MEAPTNQYPTKTKCCCEPEAIIMDERAVALGFRCFLCGTSAEDRIPADVLRELRKQNKYDHTPRQIRELERVQTQKV